jgi:hypothetical protein
MKRISLFQFVAALSVAALLTSCEDVIDINLKNAEPKYVIEANLTDQPGTSSVRFTKSVPFDEPNQFPAVQGALVVLSDETGVLDTLVEASPGLYLLKNLAHGTPGRTYTLRLEADGRVFSASSTMPQSVPLDTLTTIVFDFFGDEVLALIPNFDDPVGLGNYYQFIQFNNGQKLNGTFVFDDAFSDGIRQTRPLLNSEFETAVGDSVTVEMRSIDRQTYRYFFALDASAGTGPDAATPADPDNNFGGAALGYFSAHTVEIKSVVIE